jgi:hypothetical protein
MFITITDASKGKPFKLTDPIENSNGEKKIGISSISMWVGWYNIYEEQTCRWAREGEASNEISINPGLYNFNQLAEVLTSEVENLTLSVNPINGLIDLTVPPGIQLFLTEPIRYILGIDEIAWLKGEYEGDNMVEFVPKQIHINLKQLSTSNNLQCGMQSRLQSSQVLGFIPMSLKSKNLLGGYIEKTFSNPIFKRLTSGSINELEFDFIVEWGNGKMFKLNNHSQPIKLVLEIK